MKHVTKLINQIIFWLALAYTVFPETQDFTEWLLCVMWITVLSMLTYLMRETLDRLFVFLAGHVAAGAAGWLVIQALGEGGIMKLALCLILLYSVVLRFLPNGNVWEEPGYFYLGVLAVCFFANSAMDRSSAVRQLALAAFFVALLCKLFYDNLRGADEFIRNRASSTQLDEKKLKRLNIRISLIYVGAVGGILALVGLLRTEGISAAILNAVRHFLQWIFRGLDTTGEVQQVTEAAIESAMPEVGTMPAVDKAPIWAALEIVIEAVVTLLLIVGVIAFVVLMLIALRRHFYGRRMVADSVEDYVEPLTVRKKTEKREKRSIRERLERTPAKRIRKMYQRWMRQLERQEKWSCLSPEEQVRLLADREGLTEQEQKEILALYEKARYSGAQMSEEEARQMQALFRRQSKDGKRQK